MSVCTVGVLTPTIGGPQAVFLLIGKTSALTMNIAGVIKDWMLIFFSFYLFHAPVTALNLAGYAFCCSGAQCDGARTQPRFVHGCQPQAADCAAFGGR